MISAEEFVFAMEEKEDKEIWKLGTVTDLFESGKGKIMFDGETIASGKEYSSLNYTATIGDRVLLAVVKGTYVILGKVV